MNKRVVDAVANAINGLPLVGKAPAIPNGGRWQGFVSFAIEARNGDEFNRAMASVERLTVTITGATLDGQAMAPIVVTLGSTTVPTAVTCPADTKQPSLHDCQPDGG